jgi:hypothetical protein
MMRPAREPSMMGATGGYIIYILWKQSPAIIATILRVASSGCFVLASVRPAQLLVLPYLPKSLEFQGVAQH